MFTISTPPRFQLQTPRSCVEPVLTGSRLNRIAPIGIESLEKRAARYPQFFSRIGFVHEFRALASDEVQHLLEENWAVVSNGFLAAPPPPDIVSAIIRISGGNFRLITRLLTQMERVARINQILQLTPAVVETARMNLVIGQA